MAFRDADRIACTGADVERAARAVPLQEGFRPRVALVMGSGLGAFTGGFADRVEVPYAAIPGFPEASVDGHEGKLVLGRVAGVPVAAQAGRLHVYEGHSAATVGFPLRVLAALGARIAVLTNAAGGVHPEFRPGDLMLIRDQVNFQFRSPLRGRGPLVDGDRFVDLSLPFSERLLALAGEVALAGRIPRVHTGTYWGNAGPAYETPAEVRMIRKLGGDAVGMSTVPEVITARHLGMEVLGVSCIVNRAAGLAPERLSHEEVIRAAMGMEATLTRFMNALVPRLADAAP